MMDSRKIELVVKGIFWFAAIVAANADWYKWLQQTRWQDAQRN